jgi:hypothetical protein
MTEYKTGLMIHENRAFVERIAWHAIAVINTAVVDQEHRIIADEIGTGTACDWKGRKLILTPRAKKKSPGDKPGASV